MRWTIGNVGLGGKVELMEGPHASGAVQRQQHNDNAENIHRQNGFKGVECCSKATPESVPWAT
jgi:hypothetical protein